MHLEKLRKFIHLIERKQTGKPADVAQKLDVSRRMIYNYLAFLKEELGAPVIYNAQKESYVFDEVGKIDWQFSARATKQEFREELKNKQLVRLTQLVTLIHSEKTGTATELAKKLNIAQRTLFYQIDLLRHLFACPIEFDKNKNSYVFTHKGTINFLWKSNHCKLIAPS